MSIGSVLSLLKLRFQIRRGLLIVALWTFGSGVLLAQDFKMPTANRSLFSVKEQDRYFCGTVGRPWQSGTFGCVRSGGWQMHEGIDIRCIQRYKNEEPADPVMATADGIVVYINQRPSTSNYGNYVILQHKVDGIEVYSLYAHLARVRPGLAVRQTVKAGEIIAQMGRTTNTREQISKDRAHLHFELNLFISERFEKWYKKHYIRRSDHGLWNGQNMFGIDPQTALLVSHREGAGFNLVRFIQSSPELCRVQVRDTDFPWLKRYPQLVERKSNGEAVAGYELVLNYNGLPMRAIPRSASELKSRNKFHLLSVNMVEYRKNPCRKLVSQKKGKWEVGESGLRMLELLTD